MRYDYILLMVLLALVSACAGPDEGKTAVGRTAQAETKPYNWPEKEPIVSVVFRLDKLPNTPLTLVIENYYWDKFQPVASYQLVGNGEMLHQLSNDYAIGLYRIYFAEIKEARPVYFIVNGKDVRIDINSTYADFVKGQATIVPEDEVFVLNEAIALHRTKAEKEELLKAALSDVTNINPHYYTLKDSLREVWEKHRLQFYKQLETLSASYPDAYVTQVVVKLLRKASRYGNHDLKSAYETEPAMLNRHYF